MDTFFQNDQNPNLLDSIYSKFQLAGYNQLVNSAVYPPNFKKRKLEPSHETFQNPNPSQSAYNLRQDINEAEKNSYMAVLANQLTSNSFVNNYSSMRKKSNIPNDLNKITTAPSKISATDGDYQIVVGEALNSLSDSYEVLSFLGRGTFGQVVKCVSKTDNKLFAIKILKNHPSYLRQGNVEIQILQALSRQDTEAHNIVRAIECFQHKEHMCLVFELLEQNLYEYLKSNRFKPLSLKEIRPITQQVLVALTQLKTLGLIHADLKPENIMLVYPSSNSYLKYKVKVIDFGSACYSSKTVQNTYLQSRYYRAPEILMGLPFNEAIDMWSLGCVIAELFLGWPLYPGSSEYDQLRYIIETQGFPPSDMITKAGKCNRFFIKCPNLNKPHSYVWRLKTQEEYLTQNGHTPKEARKYIFSSLDQIREIGQLPFHGSADYEIEQEDRIKFSNLLSSMLNIRPNERIQPDSALLHPFITLEHFQSFPYIKKTHESVVLMQVCYHNQNKSQHVPPQLAPFNPISGGFLHQDQRSMMMLNTPHPQQQTNKMPIKQTNAFLSNSQSNMNSYFANLNGTSRRFRPISEYIQQEKMNNTHNSTLNSFYDLMSNSNCDNATAISLLMSAASKENISLMKKNAESLPQQNCYIKHLFSHPNMHDARNQQYMNNQQNANFYDSQSMGNQNSNDYLESTQMLLQQSKNLYNNQLMSHSFPEDMSLNSKLTCSPHHPNGNQQQQQQQQQALHNMNSQQAYRNQPYQNKINLLPNRSTMGSNNAAFMQGIIAAALVQQQNSQQPNPQLQNAQLVQCLLQQQQQQQQKLQKHNNTYPMQPFTGGSCTQSHVSNKPSTASNNISTTPMRSCNTGNGNKTSQPSASNGGSMNKQNFDNLMYFPHPTPTLNNLLLQNSMSSFDSQHQPQQQQTSSEQDVATAAALLMSKSANSNMAIALQKLIMMPNQCPQNINQLLKQKLNTQSNLYNPHTPHQSNLNMCSQPPPVNLSANQKPLRYTNNQAPCVDFNSIDPVTVLDLHLLQQQKQNRNKNQLQQSQQALTAKLIHDQKQQQQLLNKSYQDHYMCNSMKHLAYGNQPDESLMLKQMMLSLIHQQQASSSQTFGDNSHKKAQDSPRASQDYAATAKSQSLSNLASMSGTTASSNWTSLDETDSGLGITSKTPASSQFEKGKNDSVKEIKENVDKRMIMTRPGNHKPIPIGRVQPMVKESDNVVLFGGHNTIPKISNNPLNDAQDEPNQPDHNLLTKYVFMKLSQQQQTSSLDNEQLSLITSTNTNESSKNHLYPDSDRRLRGKSTPELEPSTCDFISQILSSTQQASQSDSANGFIDAESQPHDEEDDDDDEIDHSFQYISGSNFRHNTLPLI